MSERAPDYAQGFKDGFAAGLEEGKKLIPKDTVFQPSYLGMPNTCHVCGRLQNCVDGYVCYSPGCPSAVVSQTYGAVGAKGTAGPYDGSEYANKVWVNGFWTELGS